MSMFGRSDKTSDASVLQDNETRDATTPSQEKGRRADHARHDSVPSLIAAGLKVKGNLESAGEIQVDGTVEGDVRGKIVTVGVDAVVKGSVLGDSVNIAGTIEGKVEAMAVNVRKTARMTGDIIHETLQIDSGAYVDGHCSPHFGKADIRTMEPKAIPYAAGAKHQESGKAEAAQAAEN